MASSLKKRTGQVGNPLTKSLCLVLLFFQVSCGQSGEPASNAPYFWKAKKEGKVSYLLGTWHYGISLEELPCSDIILEKLKGSDLVLTELGSGGSNMAALHYSPNGSDFRHLSPRSQQFLRQKGVVGSQWSYYALSHILAQLCLKEAFGEQALHISMDQQIESLAESLNIPLQALDTLNLRHIMTENVDTKESIESRIESFHQCPKGMWEAASLYKRADLEVDLNEDRDDKINQWIFKNRNESWLAQFLSAYHHYESVFIAAGAGHFIYDFNLLDMLRQEGFHIERLSCQQP